VRRIVGEGEQRSGATGLGPIGVVCGVRSNCRTRNWGKDMTASRSARERKAGVEAGPLAKVKIDLDADRQFVYKISCSECMVKGDRNWSAYRPGGDNGFMASMDRWIFHLKEKHPTADAPCLAYLPAAQQRLQERREKDEAERSPLVGEDGT
jgi:hypothetical protein